jgi:hypothetical protein
MHRQTQKVTPNALKNAPRAITPMAVADVRSPNANNPTNININPIPFVNPKINRLSRLSVSVGTKKKIKICQQPEKKKKIGIYMKRLCQHPMVHIYHST